MLAQTPLHAWHAAHGGRMVDFAGWSMPVQYTSIVSEHNATRGAVGLFDVSHMGRLVFPHDGAALLERIVTRRVADMQPGQIRYALIANEQGGILDDVLVYHVPEQSGSSYFQLVVNASNRQKIIDWLSGHLGAATFVDVTRETAMIAVQGPRALKLVHTISSVDPHSLRYYHGCEAQLSGKPGILSRTGYTGEDGCELIVPAEDALRLWETLFAAAQETGGTAVGLGARDTLRLEAGMPLYGHELSEQINPYQAGLGYAVNVRDRAFPGREVLAAFERDAGLPCRAGWLLDGKRVPREGFGVFDGEVQLGQVTSGTFSPTLNRPIAMGYVRPEICRPGRDVTIDIRGSRETAHTIELPFYRRPS